MNHDLHHESMLTTALERKPDIAVPADFQLRLRAALSAEPYQRPTTHISFARATAYIVAACMAVVLAVLAALHPDAVKAPESMSFALEIIIVAQLMAVGFWLGTRREG